MRRNRRGVNCETNLNKTLSPLWPPLLSPSRTPPHREKHLVADSRRDCRGNCGRSTGGCCKLCDRTPNISILPHSTSEACMQASENKRPAYRKGPACRHAQEGPFAWERRLPQPRFRNETCLMNTIGVLYCVVKVALMWRCNCQVSRIPHERGTTR